MNGRRIAPLFFGWVLGRQRHRFFAAIEPPLLREVQALLDRVLEILARMLSPCLGLGRPGRILDFPAL